MNSQVFQVLMMMGMVSGGIYKSTLNVLTTDSGETLTTDSGETLTS